MNNLLLNEILREYEVKRQKAFDEAQKRKEKLSKANPKIAELDRQLAENSIKTTKIMLAADEKEKESLLQNLKKENNKLIREKKAYIKELCKDSNYLNPQFECKMCKDTGFIEKNGETKYCQCLKQALFDKAFNKSNIGNLEKENFETFNIKVFSDKPDKEKYKSDVSPRANMEIIKEKAVSFIENFDNSDEKNLLFVGPTGVGKTFLTNCIAAEVLKQGKTVLYQTAPVMFENINNEKFDRLEDDEMKIYDNLLNADLLIIDDLGSENVTDAKITDLFTIINTRLLNQDHKVNKTIISTNLSVNELFQTYTNRIGSRLAANYRFLKFYGDDIRLKKAKKMDE